MAWEVVMLETGGRLRVVRGRRRDSILAGEGGEGVGGGRRHTGKLQWDLLAHWIRESQPFVLVEGFWRGHLSCWSWLQFWTWWLGFRMNAYGTDNWVWAQREKMLSHQCNITDSQPGAISAPRNIWQYLKTILVVTTGECIYLCMSVPIHMLLASSR